MTSLGVTFDLWRTLASEPDGGAVSALRNHLRATAIHETLAVHGVKISRIDISNAMEHLQRLISEEHLHGADIGFNDRLKTAVNHMDVNAQAALGDEGLQKMGEQIDNIFIEHPPIMIDGAMKALLETKAAGFKIGLVSNVGLTSGNAYRVWLNRLGVTKIMDCMVFSNEAECAKPSAEIFEKALSSMGIQPENAIHVGDNIYADVEGAQKVGMTAVLVNALQGAKSSAIPDYTVSQISEFTQVANLFTKQRSSSGFKPK